MQEIGSTEFGFNPKYMTKNMKPWFPIMGEIHYSRYPKEYWKESLYKMKAGGVEVVSSYVLWIHHEEVEGEYDFSGSKDLREFVKMCKECGLYFMLRIGPWCHAETRNGGFPDWMLKKGFEPRTNDPRYFKEVEKYYKKIYEQVEGLLHKDNGPIIGVQIENEYGHCGGLTGEEGENHMKHLTHIAKEIGFDVPIYTATGWGGAVTGGLLPVMGGYCEAPWDQRLTEIEPSGNYIFTYERNDHNIGSDHGFGEGITFDIEKFPYLTAELGGGLQVTHHRRPVATAEDIGAMSLVKLGSGVNLLGYYMYHGGTNPKGRLSTLQESRATGSLNDLPELSYDFRAPIRQYGQMSDTLKELKLLTTFTKDFGSELCQMDARFPEDNPLFPTNLTDIRTAIRENNGSGYLFVNNYQRKNKMAEHKSVELTVDLKDETVIFPPRDIKNGDYFFYPFNMRIGDAKLISALATPYCKLNENTFVFYTDLNPRYQIEGDIGSNKIITLTKEEAKNAWKITLDQDYLIISNCDVVLNDKEIHVIGREKPYLKIYPEWKKPIEGFNKVGLEDGFTVYEGTLHEVHAEVTSKLVEDNKDKRVYELELDIPEACYNCEMHQKNMGASQINDCFLKINYRGDMAKLYLNHERIDDHFYMGTTWEIGLKRFDFSKTKTVTLEVYPLYKSAPIFLETWPDMEDDIAFDVDDISIEIEYKSIIH